MCPTCTIPLKVISAQQRKPSTTHSERCVFRLRLRPDIRASIEPVWFGSTMLYAKAMSTGGGRVKSEKTEKCLGRISRRGAGIGATTYTVCGKDCGVIGSTTTWAVWQ